MYSLQSGWDEWWGRVGWGGIGGREKHQLGHLGSKDDTHPTAHAYVPKR